MARVLGLVTGSDIHCNDSLSDVDKFSNLRALIEGRAKASIAGFALTEANYSAVTKKIRKKDRHRKSPHQRTPESTAHVRRQRPSDITNVLRQSRNTLQSVGSGVEL